MKENPIRILLVEDEFITLEALSSVLLEMNYAISGDAMNAAEAIQVLEKGKTDLAILDINIKGDRDGIWLAGQIKEKYKIPFIFLTGFGDQSTVQRAVQTEPCGYLVKPFNKVDIFAAIEVAIRNFARQHSPVQAEKDVSEADSPTFLMAHDSIFVRDHYMYVKLKIADIIYLKSDKNYIEAHLPAKKHLIRGKLKDFAELLPPERFMQVHRSYVVNMEAIDGFGGGFLKIQDTEIPMGAAYKDDLKRRLKLF